MRWRIALPRNGQPWLGLIGAVVLVAVGLGLWFALAGPSGRADAVAGALAAAASTVAALAAIYLSKEALARTDRQLASSYRATVLSRYPLLLPIHQSVSFPDSGGNIAAHPPSEERFRLSSAQSTSYAFVTDAKDTFIIPIENVGEGPALGIVSQLWRTDGSMAELVGPSALGAGRVAIMTALLQSAGEELPVAFEAAIATLGESGSGAFYWLELSYADVFGNALGASALFDPRGLGAWRYIYGPRIEPVAD
jgi:hypothetical protein